MISWISTPADWAAGSDDDDYARHSQEHAHHKAARKAEERLRAQQDTVKRRASAEAAQRLQRSLQADSAVEEAQVDDETARELRMLARRALPAGDTRPDDAGRPWPSTEPAPLESEPAQELPAAPDSHSPLLSQALEEIRSIGEAPAPQGTPGDEEIAGRMPDRRAPLDGAASAAAHADAPQASSGPPGAGQRMEARLSFIEAFYGEALDGSAEAPLLASALAQARVGLQPVSAPPLAVAPASASVAAASTPQADEAAVQDDRAPASPARTDDAWLDALATSACAGLAAGIPGPDLLNQLAAQLPVPSHAAGAASRANATPRAGAVAARAQDAPAQAARAALQRACEVLPAGDERRETLERLLGQRESGHAGGDDVGVAGQIGQQDAAVQRNIDAQHAGDSLPLLTLRAV